MSQQLPKWIISLMVLAAICLYPAAIPDVIGGARAAAVGTPCTGTTGTLTCIETNGAACNDVGNVYVAGGNKDKVAEVGDKSCKVENGGNKDCSGTAKTAGNGCTTPLSTP